MKHLTYMKAEFLATGQVGLCEALRWKAHIEGCRACYKRLKEVRENLVLLKEIRELQELKKLGELENW